MSIKLNPQRFDLKRIKEDATIVLVAKRRSGKSTCVKCLMHHFDTFCGIKSGIVCSHTEELDPFYSNFFPKLFIYDDCEKAIEKVIKRQTKIKELNEENKKKGKQLIDPRILVVLDDVIDDASFAKNKEFLNIMFNGRHYNITFIITIQSVKALPPNARQNFDYVFLFNNDINAEIKKMYDAFAGIFPTESIFRQALTTFTKNYNIMVIDMSGTTQGSLNDKFFIYKANHELIFDKFGSETFNNYNKSHYDENWKKKNTGIIFGNNKNINVIYH